MKRLLSFVFLISAIGGFNSLAQTNDASDDYFSTLKWRNIGPHRGGRSLGATGSPGRPMEYYFGATGGGLWIADEAA